MVRKGLVILILVINLILAGNNNNYCYLQAEETNSDFVDEIEPEHYICENCESLAEIIDYGGLIADGTTTHSYSGGTCTYTIYKRRARYYCYYCGWSKNVTLDNSGILAYHYCRQIHKNCSKGTYNICPL